MNQGALGNAQSPEKPQEHMSNFANPTEQVLPVHDDKCCRGTCEVAWKPGKVSKSN